MLFTPLSPSLTAGASEPVESQFEPSSCRRSEGDKLLFRLLQVFETRKKTQTRCEQSALWLLLHCGLSV